MKSGDRLVSSAALGRDLGGDPGSYVVPMGRPFGTSRETSIKIIVRPGANQVITACPD